MSNLLSMFFFSVPENLAQRSYLYMKSEEWHAYFAGHDSKQNDNDMKFIKREYIMRWVCASACVRFYSVIPDAT